MTKFFELNVTDKRTPYDGRPYYCETCGLGWGEVGACEEVDCRLEYAEKAERRKREHERGE